MALMTAVAVLLVLNMLLMHANKIYEIYTWTYKKLKKPKFSNGEFVLIDNVEFEIIYLTKTHTPYTYFCLPVYTKPGIIKETYFHESEIKKKTGLLKELE